MQYKNRMNQKMENRKTKSMTTINKECKHLVNPNQKITPTNLKNKFGQSSIQDGSSVLTRDYTGTHRDIKCLKCW